MKKIFLGGTCNNSTWRDELIPLLKVDYFNPVVEDWTSECQEIEEDEKDNKCDVHLYVITNAMTGVYSVAEVVDSVHNKHKTTVLQVIPDGFEGHAIKSLKAVVNLVNKRGGQAFFDSDLKALATRLNNQKSSIRAKHEHTLEA